MKTVLLVTSPPGSPEARRAMELAKTLHAQGQVVSVALLQDAVLASLNQNATPAAAAVRDLLAGKVPVYVAEYDLSLRGFSSANVTPGAHLADDRRLVDLMLAEGTRPLGCF